jgi:DNA-binding beta-propeller fold protein YncE
MSARRLISIALAPLCGLIGGLLFCGAPALAARGHVLEGSFGKGGSGNGELSAPANLAVNEATGEVYVLDRGNNRVEYFTAAGTYLGQFDGSGLLFGEGNPAGGGGLPEEVPTGKFDEPGGIAVDNACYEHQPRLEGSACEAFDPSNGDVYVADTHGHAELQSEGEVSKQVVDKYSATGEYVGQVSKNPSTGAFSELGFRELYGVAVDPAGGLWVEEQNFGSAPVGAADYGNGTANAFVGFRATVGAGFVREGGFAVDSQDDLYVTQEGSGEANFLGEFDSSGGLLAAALDEEATTGVATEFPSDDVYLDNVGAVARFGPEGARIEGLPIEGLSVPGMHGTGVAVNSATGQVYVADSSGVVYVFKLEEPSKPTVESESVSNISGNSATFDGEINPRGASTEYRFEFGPSEAYGNSVPIPDGSIGGGFEVRGVDLHLQSLEPGVKYHFRVVAHNANGTTDGEDRTFTTQTAGELTLLDGRSWEMVSPPAKLGANIEPIGELGVVQASVNGDAITYLTTSPTESESQGYTTGTIQVLSRRAPGGWASQDLGLPHPLATGSSVGYGYEYRFFSEDLSLGLVQPFGVFDPAVSTEASEQTPFLRAGYLNGNTAEPCLPSTMACYHPLVTGAPGYANVPSGTVFGGVQYGSEEKPCNIEALVCGPEFVDASSDSKHVVLSSPVALTPGSGGGLYEWSGGQLTPVPGIGRIGARHGISDDGSRIISTDAEVTMRDVVKGETIQLATAQGGPESGEGEFQTASADASRVFFTDGRRLTADAGGGRDLYECEMVEVAGKLTCKLSDLTPPGAGGEPAGVLGGVIGASEDGSYVYFVAQGVLAAGAVHGTCGARGREACNLYVRHDGVTKLVAVLAGADANDWATTLGHQTARVSPDGQWLAFMSEQDLTGYVTRDALSGKPDEEVYLYDAGSGALVCASCDPTGARPMGVPYARIGNGLAGGDRVWEAGQGIAANVPGWTPYELTVSLHQSRYLSDSGRLFFNSSDALVPQDVNGAEDVYEYEPPGVGDCASTSTTYSERSRGCIDLISSGTSGEESGFLDASGSGGDVFFLTAAKLSAQDHDTALDVYDAHECTSASPCLPVSAGALPPCTTGDACKPSPTPQPSIFGAPSSATFSGAGNIAAAVGAPTSAPSVKSKGLTRARKLARALKACHRKRRKPRATCERLARTRYAQGSHKANATKRSKG